MLLRYMANKITLVWGTVWVIEQGSEEQAVHIRASLLKIDLRPSISICNAKEDFYVWKNKSNLYGINYKTLKIEKMLFKILI